MVTLNKPAEGNTDWATAINDNWTTLEDSVLLNETQTLANKTLNDPKITAGTENAKRCGILSDVARHRALLCAMTPTDLLPVGSISYTNINLTNAVCQEKVRRSGGIGKIAIEDSLTGRM